MPEHKRKLRKRAPRHLWIVGILALLWNAMGALDYTMMKAENEAYMEAFTAEEIEFYHGLPAWMVAFWAVAVWSGLLGAILLLLRRRGAVPVFGVSLASLVVTAVHDYGFTNAYEILGVSGLGITLLVFVSSLFLYRYAGTLKRRGVLA